MQDAFVPTLIQHLKMIDHGLYIESSHSLSMQILIMLWPWIFVGPKFVIMLLIWSIEKSSDSERCDHVWLKIYRKTIVTNKQIVYSNTMAKCIAWPICSICRRFAFFLQKTLVTALRTVITVSNTYVPRAVISWQLRCLVRTVISVRDTYNCPQRLSVGDSSNCLQDS